MSHLAKGYAYLNYPPNIPMLLSIKVENWRSHANTQMEFSPGANLLLGPMGAGKSSIVDALCYALYGAYPKLRRHHIKTADVANFKRKGEPVKVELEFLANGGEKYKVRRIMGKKSEALLWQDGKIIQKGPKPVSEYIEELLGIPYDLFSRAVYSEQNRLEYWLSLAPAERKNELDRLLGLDTFETVRSRCSQDITRKKETATQLERDSPLNEMEEARERLDKAMEKLHSVERELLQLEKEHEKVKQNAVAARKKWELLDRKRAEASEISLKMSKIKGELEVLEKQAALFDEEELKKAREGLESLGRQKGELDRENRERESLARKLKQDEGRLNANMLAEQERMRKRKELEERLVKLCLGKQKEHWENEKQRAMQESDMASKKEAGILARLAELEKTIDLLGEGTDGAKCPVCDSGLDGRKLEEIARDKKLQKEKLLAELGKEREKKEKLEKELAEISNRAAEIGKVIAQIESVGKGEAHDYAKELGIVREKMAKLEEGIEGGRKKKRELEKCESELVSKIDMLKRAQKAKMQIIGSGKELETLEKRLKTISFSQQEFALAAKEMELAGNALATHEEKLRSHKQMAEQAKELVKATGNALENLEKKRKEAGKIRKEIEELSLFRNIVVQAQAQTRKYLIGEINGLLKKIWPLLYPYGDWKEVRIIANEKGYAIEIRQDGWKELETFASGGERAAVGLSVRISLSLLLTPQLGWLILDEPTHNLDSNAVRALGVSLSEQLPKIMGQVIVITHDAGLLESTPGRVFRFKRDKEFGGDTAVAQD